MFRIILLVGILFITIVNNEVYAYRGGNQAVPFSVQHGLGFPANSLLREAQVANAPRTAPSETNRRVPTVDDLLNVKGLGGAQISPDGHCVAYSATETDWKQDAFVSHLWLANVATGKSLQLTRGEIGGRRAMVTLGRMAGVHQ